MDIAAQDLQPVSVVIVNHNAGPLIIECVRRALDQAQEVIVVDNASTDSSANDLMHCFSRNSQFSMIRLEKNSGFAAGSNTGLNATTQPYILFLNPDCILGPDSLRIMVEAIVSESGTGMAGGYLINPDGSEQGGGRRAMPTPWRAFVRAFGLYRLEKYWPRLFFDFHLHKQPLPRSPIEVEAISGALMLVRREAANDAGWWDEGYFLHCEDLDWCMRFKQKNWKIVFVPDAPVTHFQGTCSHSRPFFVAWHKHKGMVRFYRKFFHQQYPGVLMVMVISGVWLRFAATVTFYAMRRSYQKLKLKHG
ncbi:MAG: glycosyltransferase family 2 protein [Nitrosomonas sp.]|nr:MAG: glycosyltransferase family 2 protein [Nitrosomonas sp.]